MKLIFSQTITLANAQPIKVTLGEDTQVLDEVVVTALGIKRATKALSYNVQEVKGDELTAVKDANFMNSLSGKVAGVQINSGATGAGGATRVVMRGMKSLTKDNNALYVIDGVPVVSGDIAVSGVSNDSKAFNIMSSINPSDIENITVLKDAAATAVYGSRGANGVVLVTTKRGLEVKKAKHRSILKRTGGFLIGLLKTEKLFQENNSTNLPMKHITMKVFCIKICQKKKQELMHKMVRILLPL